MKQEITLQNTSISFTPSFLGNGWETSLLPRRDYPSPDFRITFEWIRKLFGKMRKSGQERKEDASWTTNAVAS